MWDKIARTISSVAPALSTALLGPAGGAAVTAIAGLFGVDETPEAIEKAVSSPGATQKLQQLDAEFVRARADVMKTMLESDAKNPHSTRPAIALGAFRVLAFCTVLVVSMWAVAVIRSDDELLKTVVDGWPFIATVTGSFVTLLGHYFGVLRRESQDKLNAMSGICSVGLLQRVASIWKR